MRPLPIQGMSVGADRHILSRRSVVGIRAMLNSGADRVVFDRLAQRSGEGEC